MICFTPAQVRAYLDDDEVPFSIACAIHGRLVCQPVHAPGMPQIYEGSALGDWLERNSTNPFSRMPLQASSLLPAPQAHQAANRFRRLVNAECQRRAAVPELSPAAAQSLRAIGAAHLCMRYRNARLRAPRSPIVVVDTIPPTARRRLAELLEQVEGPVPLPHLTQALAFARARRHIEERRVLLIWGANEQNLPADAATRRALHL